ncbi:hypothetical protein BHF71_01935 [Vulcanibacillus modesticaldus]|uniref:FAD-dependent oxidoreductase 2 FAD-binding domain-containing protein n=1 Tax=Vulcanibacillus modesticaldus TaxID=337097 RepID=A0A1D2YUM6_9BACI|nr:FAD-binding protein [Vulcanibacillus modesticaldus]OEF99373.1 hypothetical protein BHF71_01935 [Vulcanibacillus modesticaldus]
MFDVIVIGQGLTGMLTAIWLKKKGKSVAIVHQGTGKIIQSTGLMDILPGMDGTIEDLIKEYQIERWNDVFIKESIESFNMLMRDLGYPYRGDVGKPVEVITGSGHIKLTGLFPETIVPFPKKGNIAIVSFKEITDFQSEYVKGNLQKRRPELVIYSVNVSLGKNSNRTMNQLDAARLLEKSDVRKYVIAQIKKYFDKKVIDKLDLVVFPSVLGVMEWKTVLNEFEMEIGSPITEAVGMPPNATAIRLNEFLKKEMIRQGIRLYSDTTVISAKVEKRRIEKINIVNNKFNNLKAKNYVLATGEVLGGGLEDASLSNLFVVGATNDSKVTRYGITGGIYSILSSYEAVSMISGAYSHGNTIKGGDN